MNIKTIEEPDSPSSERYTILVIDDEELNHRVIELALAKPCYRLIFCFHGAQGVELAMQELPDLVLLDVRMPLMDGYEVCRVLKASDKLRDIPVLFLTAMGELEDKVEGFRVGGIDYILKPFEAEELEARVQAQLQRYSTLQRFKEGLAKPMECKEESQASPAALPAKKIGRAMMLRERLLADIASPPTLGQLAIELGCSEKHLAREFKKVFGSPPASWLRAHRMQEACRLLRETDFSIERIAGEIGYSAQCNFAIAFKQHFKMSPRQFRKLSK